MYYKTRLLSIRWPAWTMLFTAGLILSSGTLNYLRPKETPIEAVIFDLPSRKLPDRQTEAMDTRAVRLIFTATATTSSGPF